MIPIEQYPRPDFRRECFTLLDGKWGFSFDDSNVGEKNGYYNGFNKQYDINVPFCYQCELSDVNDLDHHPYMWYETSFSVTEENLEKRVFINFGAVDYVAKVWLNGVFIGQHKGGNTSFSMEISDYIKKENKLVVKAEDLDSTEQPRGKQYWKKKPDRCWYTPTSGIWQSVYITYTGEVAIDKLRLTPDIDNSKISVNVYVDKEIKGLSAAIEIYYKGEHIKSTTSSFDTKVLSLDIGICEEDYIDEIHYWTPDSPNLYDITVSIIKDGATLDTIQSYFGMRKVHIHNGKILLNNRPFYQKLILDQGYWKSSLLTPPDTETIVRDITLTKRMGFNGVRKHQKAEDPRFYYLADKLGLVVWGELPSAYCFNDNEMKNLLSEWQEFIERDYNHPSIICWVPLNESWGVRNVFKNTRQQQFSVAMYHLTKALDPTRIVSTNDGWEQVESDICGIHDYVGTGNEFLKKYSDMQNILTQSATNRMTYADGTVYNNQPILITEFGGIAFESSREEDWGYSGTVKTTDEFITRFKGLIKAIESIKCINGYCYTQLTDTMQETNGLLTDERVPKLPLEEIAAIIGGEDENQN